jgi:AraC family transcriptional regulator
LVRGPDGVLGKIARIPRSSERIAHAVAERRRIGVGGSRCADTLASGAGWRILDVVCTCDASDRPGEEQHSHYSLAMVLGGAFHYRGRDGAAYLPAGSILIGQAGAQFRCWHGFGAGDRCFAVQFEADAFHELLSTLDMAIDLRTLPVAIPVDRRTAGIFASAELLSGVSAISGDQGLSLAVAMAGRILELSNASISRTVTIRRRHVNTVLELARWIETDPATEHTLPALAAMAGMSRFHLVRVFKQVVGVPPYAFISRARLREAAISVAGTDEPIVDIALRAGFSDLSTFNARFRKQFARSPRAVRQLVRTGRGYVALMTCEREAIGHDVRRPASN